MKAIFDKVSQRTSRMVTQNYSTSFSLGILFLNRKLHRHIYAIYGFVRLADEIVDSFHQHDKVRLLQDFKEQTHWAIEEGISLNPVLNSFQHTARKFGIEWDLIALFFNSMEMDLHKSGNYSRESYETYILGSAEVVGLMCLKIFCFGNEKQYQTLRYNAMKLGAAFQKINFLRDLQTDYHQLGRVYFPGVEMKEFDNATKKTIEKEIDKDFKAGFEGIVQLPKNARLGVYVAYVYYYSLFRKIKTLPSHSILNQRVRIPNRNKYGLLLSSYVRHSFNLL